MIELKYDQDLQTVVLHAPIGICILSAANLKAEIVNDKFLEVAGKTSDMIIGKHYCDAFAEVRQYHEQALNDVIRYAEPYQANEVELELIRHGNPEKVYVTFVYSPILDMQGFVSKVAIWLLDNTPQVMARLKTEAANKELELAQDALKVALSAANFGTWYIHSVTRAFVTDARLKELFGYEPDQELSIEQALAQITDEYRDYVSTALENAINKGGDYDVTYSVIGLNDRKLRWLRAIGNLKADPSGEFSAFTGVVMDITEQKRDEQRKNDFIGIVSHELKTPLTSLKAYLQVLQAKANADDTFTNSALNQSVKQIRKMTTMINSFLNVSRLEAGKIHMNKQSFDMSLLIKEIEEETEVMNASHHIMFEEMETVFVNADRDKIGQVISNLISNAMKYSNVGTTIRIACIKMDNTIQLSVKDEGIGVAEKDREQLFDRYYRVESNTLVSGFGIGLYLSAEIIDHHQGKIWVESDFGKGSVFYFTLPLVDV
ncbi:PAS domain-containing sensor histidine kinase [Pedobacter psychroterrae]|uniref:histidine kinase n=1 Tax=Pedobacter psychroterrae TaxID=2530453 RepID=A0A4R0NAP9_9SPHI|nr:ATP-binding protein [Pedobacter psychroterrae]TCC97349.1 PAS domain-containing sensor histidine kinase [Pedobacter psychroterrae]